MNCLRCNGDVWDNRAKKAAGTFKANAPDFSCKNKDGCGWNSGFGAKTSPAPQGYTQTAPAPAPTPLQVPSNPLAAVTPSPRDTFLIELYWDSFDRIMEGVAKRKLADLLKPEHIGSLVATLYIQRAKG